MTTTPAITLPTFLVLQSVYNKKYLQYLDEQGQVHGLLKFSGEVALSQYTKYEVVKANVGNGLVHLKCSYNNKYWVRSTQTQHWIAAAADKPEEDKSKWTCTLFEPIFINANTVRFRHMQLGHYACLWRAAAPHDSCLFGGAANVDKDQCDVYTIIDWESLAKLPTFLALQSFYNKKYLRYLNEEGQVHGLLKFSGEVALSQYTKYEVVKANVENGLVHLKCSNNNKYWVRTTQTQHWIDAAADKPEEDKSKWTCTLFEPIFIDANTVRFRHVQLGHYACLWRAAAPYDSCLFGGAANVDKDQCDVYTIIDWGSLEALMILPKYVAFKGDNGSYLVTSESGGQQYLQYSSNDIGDPAVGNEIFTTSDGSVRIKSSQVDRFWRRSPNWIWADSNDSTTNNSDTLFWPLKVDDNVVALRNIGNNQFCKRLTTDGLTNCLNASISTVTEEARMEVEELVISRNIYYVDFRLMDAKVYDQSVLTVATGNAENKTQEPNTIDIRLSYTNTKSSRWNSNVTLKLGVKTTIESDVPLIVDDGKVEILDHFSGAYQWGKTETSTDVVEVVYKVTVPPMTIVTVNLLAMKGSCDVPFSYSQADTLFNGENITYDMDDGVYTGINCYNFKYETKQEPL